MFFKQISRFIVVLFFSMSALSVHAQTTIQPYVSTQPTQQQMMPSTGQNPVVVPTGSVQTGGSMMQLQPTDGQNPAVYGNAAFDQGEKPWNSLASSWMPPGEFQEKMMGRVHPFMALGMGIWFVVWTVNSVLIGMLLMTLIRKFNK